MGRIAFIIATAATFWILFAELNSNVRSAGA